MSHFKVDMRGVKHVSLKNLLFESKRVFPVYPMIINEFFTLMVSGHDGIQWRWQALSATQEPTLSDRPGK